MGVVVLDDTEAVCLGIFKHDQPPDYVVKFGVQTRPPCFSTALASVGPDARIATAYVEPHARLTLLTVNTVTASIGVWIPRIWLKFWAETI